ncbi:MAG: hypothetical protein EOR46_30260 [Mesorhizobium sp.]|nr:MAG: hypothetical protein EOR46_30260 [Mesorhizobium sp.]RWK74903.1 MAG: hypothetical protein EOR51_32885 [Mesorhizobium sp.]RWL03787.1 MAG: hypothetical protein EOR56_31990 [Mesorhizobium sp.]
MALSGTLPISPRGGDARQGRGGREGSPAFALTHSQPGTSLRRSYEWLQGRRDSAPLCPAGHLPHKGEIGCHSAFANLQH